MYPALNQEAADSKLTAVNTSLLSKCAALAAFESEGRKPILPGPRRRTIVARSSRSFA